MTPCQGGFSLEGRVPQEIGFACDKEGGKVFEINSFWQILGWIMVFLGLILFNELARRTKVGGITMFVALPIVMTIYCIAVSVAAANGVQGIWGVDNPTVLFQNGWFHYAKVYAALAGCIGFMMLKYRWGIGKTEWFKCFPFVIVAINIMIANVSDFESAWHFFSGVGTFVLPDGSVAWITSEKATQVCGWNNVFNGVAGLFNIFCMTGWWGIYSSKKHDDMLWPDMTWVFIIAYDVWNFTYTYNCLPNHAWYCGFALLLAPTVAYFIWNRGGWIQNRANTLAIWCIFAQLLPTFQDSFPDYGVDSVFAVNSTLNYGANLAWSIAALVINVAAFGYIIYRAKKLHRNPYTQEVFVGTADYRKALARADEESLKVFEDKNGMKASEVLSA